MRKQVDLVNQKAEPEDIVEAIHSVMHLYRARQFRALRDADSGVTHMESKALGFFARRPGATLSELVAHAERDKGQLARLVGGLRERGLLEARADDADRRQQRLHLTAAGEQAQQALRRQGRKVAAQAVQGMDEPSRAALMTLLTQVRANLETSAG